MKCGHPESLRVRSVESDAEFCELCDTRQRCADAERSEAALRRGIRQLRRDVVNSRLSADEARAAIAKRLAAIEGQS